MKHPIGNIGKELITFSNAPREMIDISKFYVISVCSNPIRYETRWKLFRNFEKHMADVGAKLIVVEQAFGDREFQLTQRDNPMHVQVRTRSELWHKENMINLGINYLTQIDPGWQYVAWIDGDIHFQRPDIISETAHQLQHYDWVQMFSHAIDLGPELQPLKTHSGFMWSYQQNNFCPPKGPGNGGYYAYKTGFWHPGYAWAARRRAFNRVSLLDIGILGAGDHHMALSLIGAAPKSLPHNVTRGYREAVMGWQDLVISEFKMNVGYVPGTITHYWHGSKNNRKYVERWKVIVENKFDPSTDLFRDGQGLYVLATNNHRQIRLRNQIRQYFRQRNEDCTYLD